MFVGVTEGRLDAGAARSRVVRPRNGAVVVFEGVVRDHHEGRAVTKVEYHGYKPMVERELRAIAEACAARHRVEDVVVEHRLGELAIGETSLIVAVAAEHREAAFGCATEIVDTLKARVPIWKKEWGPDGARWQHGCRAPGAGESGG